MTDTTPPEVLAAREICAARFDNEFPSTAAAFREGNCDNTGTLTLTLAGIRAGLAMREAEVVRIREGLGAIQANTQPIGSNGHPSSAELARRTLAGEPL